MYFTVDEDRLGIFKTFFEKYKAYLSFHIQVTGIDTQEEKPNGNAKLYVHINRPPKPGRCLLSNTVGIAMISVFQMEFLGWTDPEKHKIRDYSIYSKYALFLFTICCHVFFSFL